MVAWIMDRKLVAPARRSIITSKLGRIYSYLYSSDIPSGSACAIVASLGLKS